MLAEKKNKKIKKKKKMKKKKKTRFHGGEETCDRISP